MLEKEISQLGVILGAGKSWPRFLELWRNVHGDFTLRGDFLAFEIAGYGRLTLESEF